VEEGPDGDGLKGRGKACKATWYSRASCIGCSKDRRTASGEPLNDGALTAAVPGFGGKPYSMRVTCCGKGCRKGASVTVRVNDKGGTGCIDLTPASRNAIGMGDIGYVCLGR
jgi:rare lipoprotein A (peptidoglycan hydrolase)